MDGSLLFPDIYVYKLIENIEITTQKHLNIPQMASYNPGDDIQSSDVLKEEAILMKREAIAKMPLKYESCSIELFKAVVNLWVTIRGYLFAEGWTAHFKKNEKSSIRKALMSIGTVKERGREEISFRLASFHFLYCPLIFRAGPQG